MNHLNNRKGLTWTAAADMLGVSRSTIRQWRDKGWLVTFDDGSIDVGATQRRVDDLRAGNPGREDADTGGSGDRGAPGRITYAEARCRKMVAEAERAEYELKRLRGDLISVADAQRVYCDIIAKARANIEAVPNRCAELLVGKTDANEIRRILQGHIEDALKVVCGDAPVAGNAPV